MVLWFRKIPILFMKDAETNKKIILKEKYETIPITYKNKIVGEVTNIVYSKSKDALVGDFRIDIRPDALGYAPYFNYTIKNRIISKARITEVRLTHRPINKKYVLKSPRLKRKTILKIA